MANNLPVRSLEAEFACRLRDLRQARNMSRKDLARRCAEAGAPVFTEMVITRLENGQRRVNLDDVYALAYVLGVSPLAMYTPASGDADVALTATVTAPAASVYEWTVGERPAPTSGDVNQTARQAARLRLYQSIPYASRTYGALDLTIHEDNIKQILRDNGKGEIQ